MSEWAISLLKDKAIPSRFPLPQSLSHCWDKINDIHNLKEETNIFWLKVIVHVFKAKMACQRGTEQESCLHHGCQETKRKMEELEGEIHLLRSNPWWPASSNRLQLATLHSAIVSPQHKHFPDPPHLNTGELCGDHTRSQAQPFTVGPKRLLPKVLCKCLLFISNSYQGFDSSSMLKSPSLKSLRLEISS